jgi:ATPase subunit of ABC transporter with duplicated ATPase domains
LLELTDEILELSGGKLRSYGASFPEYQRLRQVEDSAAERAVASADQAVKREKAHAQRSRERQMKRTAAGARKRDTSGQAKIILGVWKESSEKTTARLTTVHERRVQEAKSRLEEAKTKIRQENTLKLDLPASTLPAGKVVLEVRDLKYDYPDSEQSLLGGVSFTIVGPERVAICGDNGSGKTTLLKIILGQIAPTGGSISLGVREVVYLPQNTFALDPSASVLANFQTLSNIYNDGEARQRLSRLLFFGDDVYKPVSVLSGGERIKLALGGVLSSPTQVQLLVIDEPTNHLDLNSIEQLESALQQYQGALIVVSHDMSFLRSIGVERELHIEREH